MNENEKFYRVHGHDLKLLREEVDLTKCIYPDTLSKAIRTGGGNVYISLEAEEEEREEKKM